ncbi:MAG: Ribonuclease 3 [Candidatus Beckwithbacteria bacterium GW2011_GWB1_47_15]|uniref:Ribonuclease 3 n=1 Tax=Candidatus Beckwithbacteria bacterium GW2011_GWB1_47_15 TaxID=1618371 RepID=A0A0G1UUG8_9BACT|nr:MAG: rnc, ribonuclease III, ribonuclease III [Candidatus Beckwithbacteria bacterium GW2011_GWC1_49_16]KKU35275.1 MAG: Ribonuclease 3 [Candidatus Beckwithbacteria bacterium GW2011_GWA1_46_30]KKU61370.1 MAG: Ribonuclease 3 [Candidatus Beckwithbacteria bacterium GW2011_GWB1_47_15]KKU71777.1 MAG: Ribonuclease 3 [Candidatus Beckwithbacteria bacterium GW2011_GWA2_47_25]KKW03010.1 MAG: Ribonuclease 3 [Candidatus Beckwithbacteria bacterium GW2011_GWC2_49_11]OGD48723.1 MAG: ribonuclease III [Candida
MINQVGSVTFKNADLIKLALTHRSALNEHPEIASSNERLEFLGDAVLEIVVSNFLYHQFPQKEEGELTHLRAKIVQTKTLAAAAKNLKLQDRLILSKGEARAQGRSKPSILANTFEAVVGAIYLDQGLNLARQFITDHLLVKLDKIVKDAKVTDYKSRLQEIWQKSHHRAPRYQVVKTRGPDHLKSFTVKVILGQSFALGSGPSKQAAEQTAAQKALEKNPLI